MLFNDTFPNHFRKKVVWRNAISYLRTNKRTCRPYQWKFEESEEQDYDSHNRSTLQRVRKQLLGTGSVSCWEYTFCGLLSENALLWFPVFFSRSPLFFLLTSLCCSLNADGYGSFSGQREWMDDLNVRQTPIRSFISYYLLGVFEATVRRQLELNR